MKRAGFVTFLGLPNAGKSSLLNRLVGERLAITSSKPQSTRHRVVGIRTVEDAQMVIFDTPGLLEPRDTLHEAMRSSVQRAVRDADVLVYVADATRPDNHRIPWHLTGLTVAAGRIPVVTAVNKIDRLRPNEIARLAGEFPDAVPVSARTGRGIDDLVTAITSHLPLSPYLYPDDELSTMPVRFFCAEYIREVAFERLGDELPHALTCDIEEYREGSLPLYIRATLYVERESQKRIVIGSNGQQIKQIGRAAREKIEQFVGHPVYLDLWVKVLPGWRKNRRAVSRFGYGEPEKKV